MKRVLVTGAAGFVGTHLLEALSGQGLHVTALATDDAPGDGRALASWMYGDLRDPGYVEAAVATACPDTVVHLAAISHLPTAAADPALAWDVNVTATVRLLHELGRRALQAVRRTRISPALWRGTLCAWRLGRS